MSPMTTFRTRRGRAIQLDPLAALRSLGKETSMPSSRKRGLGRQDAIRPTACPECSGRVFRLFDAQGERVFADLPNQALPSRHRACMVVDDDGTARELAEGQAPNDGQPAFVPHRLTCKVALQAAREAAIDRMEDRSRTAVATA